MFKMQIPIVNVKCIQAIRFSFLQTSNVIIVYKVDK